MINAINNNQFLFVPLSLSLLFFLRKGVQYALIGSYVPLLVVAVFLIAMTAGLRNNEKIFLLTTRIWGITMILWSVARILIGSVNYATGTVDEYHLTNQLGNWWIGLSIAMLVIGILILRNAKRKRIKSWR